MTKGFPTDLHAMHSFGSGVVGSWSARSATLLCLAMAFTTSEAVSPLNVLLFEALVPGTAHRNLGHTRGGSGTLAGQSWRVGRSHGEFGGGHQECRRKKNVFGK